MAKITQEELAKKIATGAQIVKDEPYDRLADVILELQKLNEKEPIKVESAPSIPDYAPYMLQMANIIKEMQDRQSLFNKELLEKLSKDKVVEVIPERDDNTNKIIKLRGKVEYQ
jgi:hypothetical protein